jgi:hypothetical protein
MADNAERDASRPIVPTKPYLPNFIERHPMSSESKLSLFLKTGPDWGKLKTSVPGIFVLKMSAYKNSPARLAVELNPVDASGLADQEEGPRPEVKGGVRRVQGDISGREARTSP